MREAATQGRLDSSHPLVLAAAGLAAAAGELDDGTRQCRQVQIGERRHALAKRRALARHRARPLPRHRPPQSLTQRRSRLALEGEGGLGGALDACGGGSGLRGGRVEHAQAAARALVSARFTDLEVRVRHKGHQQRRQARRRRERQQLARARRHAGEREQEQWEVRRLQLSPSRRLLGGWQKPPKTEYPEHRVEMSAPQRRSRAYDGVRVGRSRLRRRRDRRDRIGGILGRGGVGGAHHGEHVRGGRVQQR